MNDPEPEQPQLPPELWDWRHTHTHTHEQLQLDLTTPPKEPTP